MPLEVGTIETVAIRDVWAIRYTVDASYQDEPDSDAMRELNRASDAMRCVFEPHLKELDPRLDRDSSDAADDALGMN